ncbi:MAG: hypothetical protein ABSE63_09795 [Thermoguttaceae bacterium]|jgi:hypothetical protein
MNYWVKVVIFLLRMILSDEFGSGWGIKRWGKRLGCLHLEKVARGEIHIRAVLVFLGVFGGFCPNRIFVKKGDCWPGYIQRWYKIRIFNRHREHKENKEQDEE